MATLRTLLGAHGAVAGSPAEPGVIAEVAALFRSELPQDLVDVWGVSNGLALDPIGADLLSSEQVLEFSREGPAGLLPLFTDRQSNYLALAMDGLRAPRVIHIPHDDGPRLLFNGTESCVDALLACLESGESLDLFLSETHGDYGPDTRRSERDQQAARALLLTDGENNEWNFATQLLDETNLAEFARLLETDHFVRRDVRARMDAMASPAIRELRAADRKSFAQFSDNLATSAQAAGLRVEKSSAEEKMRIGGIFVSLEAFFHLRHQPDAMARTLARIRELIALKAKRA
jgi:hypothetical protein